MGDRGIQNGSSALKSRRSRSVRSKSLCFHLKALTWESDSHGLFDYESRNHHAKTFKCSAARDAYRVVRVGTDVQLVNEDDAISLLTSDNRAVVLATLYWENDSLYLVARKGHNLVINEHLPDNMPGRDGVATAPGEKLWLVVRERGIPLSEGDVVKLGRFKLKVREICLEANAQKSTRKDRSKEGASTVPAQEALQNPTNPDLPAEDNNSACRNRGIVPASLTVPTEVESDDSGIEGVIRPIRTDVNDTGREMTDTDVEDAENNNGRSPGQDKVCTKTMEDCSDVESCAVHLKDRAISRNRAQFRAGPSPSSLPNCRICLCEEDEPDENPLISPCKCDGSMKYVHLDCLRTWMEGRLGVKRDGPMLSFYWQALECELCQLPYPSHVKARGNDSSSGQIELLNLPRPVPPYIVLEPRLQSGKGLHVVSLAGAKQAKLGRGHESDIRLSDISVSRHHASLKFSLTASKIVANAPMGSHFILEDLNSKFGTLLEIRKPFRMEPGISMCLQVGRTVLHFNVRKKWHLMPLCFKSNRTDRDIAVSAGGSADCHQLALTVPQQSLDQASVLSGDSFGAPNVSARAARPVSTDPGNVTEVVQDVHAM